MKKLTLVTVGKIKTSYWSAAADEYRKRLSRLCRVEEIVVRDADSALPREAGVKQEGERILSALPTAQAVVCLDEQGEHLTSREFAAMLEKFEQQAAPACLVVGGAYGLAGAVLARARRTICLGRLTYTHELAQVILWEQLFRASAIIRGTGYHHD